MLGVLGYNENNSDKIVNILQEVQQHQGSIGDDAARVYADLSIVGDQLTVERGVNAKFNVANGFTPEERFENMHFEVADFHSEMKFLQVR